MGLVNKIFGSRNERELKRLWPLVQKINALEPSIKAKSDSELRNQTLIFKERLSNGESLDALLPEAFATVREASVRILGMRHFDVQLLGGMILHHGAIAEMRTGEGKTLCATLPVYLNALTGKGVHLVTVNDYLARRDAAWMGKIYSFLGLSTGVVVHDMTFPEKKAAYLADITYGQNNEFGFDYLRDNMKIELEDMVQRGHSFAIVDEVDSILIDEARTPLIISGAVDQTTDKYIEADKIVQKLKSEEHFAVELKTKNVTLTEDGVKRIEEMLRLDNLYDPANIILVHHINQALKARVVMKRDFDYVVRDGQIVIVDEFTGRLMSGRRWSDGLHQAVEAKEGVAIQKESQTLATITFQNYFRMYQKLAGMTGTADTEAVEFKKIYNLDVVIVPTNQPMVRDDRADVIYPKERGKFNAVCNEIEDCAKRGQPVLVGTASIARSEMLSEILTKRGVKHHVLNAKQHEREAEIIAQAGRLGAVTISTNMAGRGTDILLGGNPEFLAAAEAGTKDESDAEYQEALKKFSKICAEEKQKVRAAGGLHVLGTERHESRRIDNQLRGRSGRQGDPGSTQFYVSLEDDLMKRFGGERLQAIMTRVGMTEDDAIGGKMVASSIERAQKRVEGYNFEIRKHLIDYDDVMTKQRNVVYSLRERIMRGDGLEELLKDITEDVIEDLILLRVNEKEPVEKWDVAGIISEFKRLLSIDMSREGYLEKQENAGPDFAQELFDAFKENAATRLSKRKSHFGEERLLKLSRVVYLQALDYYWKEHLSSMDGLKEGISLRGYGQKNPLHEYQRESFELFTAMMMTVKSVVVQNIFVPDLPSEKEIEELEEREREAQRAREAAAKTVHEEVSTGTAKSEQADLQGLNREQRRKVAAQQPASSAVNAPENAPTQAALLAHFREQRGKGKKKG